MRLGRADARARRAALQVLRQSKSRGILVREQRHAVWLALSRIHGAAVRSDAPNRDEPLAPSRERIGQQAKAAVGGDDNFEPALTDTCRNRVREVRVTVDVAHFGNSGTSCVPR